MLNLFAFPFYRTFISYFYLFFTELDEDFDSDESSGKDWSELEEEAKRGIFLIPLTIFYIQPSIYYF